MFSAQRPQAVPENTTVKIRQYDGVAKVAKYYICIKGV